MSICELCFSRLRGEDKVICAACRVDRDYYDEMTPEEHAIELSKIADYVADPEDRS